MENASEPRRTWRSVLKHVADVSRLHLRIALLRIINAASRSPITGDLDVVLSMTTYGPRTKLVYLTIESIVLRGPRPTRFILWLDEQDVLDNPPKQLRRLARRGLEILQCENFGPHKKLYPTARLLPDITRPVVTCDDDVLYPAGWLAALENASTEHPGAVNGFRARTMQFDGDRISSYVTWPLCTTDAESFRHVLTNVSGCVYPPEFVREVREAGTVFMQQCPTADDLWLHHLALRTGFPCRQLTVRHLQLSVVPGSQAVSLQNVNIEEHQNDKVIATLYDEADIDRLKHAAPVN